VAPKPSAIPPIAVPIIQYLISLAEIIFALKSFVDTWWTPETTKPAQGGLSH
jgi:hypothetical protein